MSSADLDASSSAPGRARSPGCASASRRPAALGFGARACRCAASRRWTRCCAGDGRRRGRASTPAAARCSPPAPGVELQALRTRASWRDALAGRHGAASATARCATATAAPALAIPADDSPLHVPWARHHAALLDGRAARAALRARARRRPRRSREGRRMMTGVELRRAALGRPGLRSSRSSAAPTRRRGRARCSPASSPSRRRLPRRVPGRGHARLPDRVPLRRRVAHHERRRRRAATAAAASRGTMLEQLFERTGGRRHRGYTLEVRVSNDGAIRLYERLGFSPTGVRRGYYTDNREDALIMWRDARAGRVILAIETSCDETAAAVVDGDGRHAARASSPRRPSCTRRYGGVVPEVASRRHLELVGAGGRARRWPTRASTFGRPRRGRRDRGAGADRRAAGRAWRRAKALAFAPRLPLIPVDHLHGHVAAAVPRAGAARAAVPGLLASGGHTLLRRGGRPRAATRVLGAHPRRRGRRGVRQGRAAARPRLPGRAGARAARPRAATRRRTAFPVAMAGPARPRLLVQRAEDGAALRAVRDDGGATGRPGRVLPGRDRRARWSSARRGARRDRARHAGVVGGVARNGVLRDGVRARRCARAGRAPGPGAARALHRQRGDDRVGGPLRRRRSRIPTTCPATPTRRLRDRRGAHADRRPGCHLCDEANARARGRCASRYGLRPRRGGHHRRPRRSRPSTASRSRSSSSPAARPSSTASTRTSFAAGSRRHKRAR